MRWLDAFDLFLFDFDGLLVNTEPLHYQAYQLMVSKQGHHLPWSFVEFCKHAHGHAISLQEAIYKVLPTLPADWPSLYAEKQRAYQELLLEGKVELMPGVPKLLDALAHAGKRRCVVTNSLPQDTFLVRPLHPILDTLPHWITRADCSSPKPDPEGYLKAIQLYGAPGDRVIGFEDSGVGLAALLQTSALPCFICPSYYPFPKECLVSGRVRHFESFEALDACFSLEVDRSIPK